MGPSNPKSCASTNSARVAYVSVYAGDPAAAIDELNQQVAAVDGMGVPDPTGAKVAALTNIAQIAIHIRNAAAADDA